MLINLSMSYYSTQTSLTGSKQDAFPFETSEEGDNKTPAMPTQKGLPLWDNLI